MGHIIAKPFHNHCNEHHHTEAHRRVYPKSCRDPAVAVSGVHHIQPEWPFREPMLVYCDQEYESGGWTVIQRRIDGTVSFDRDALDYAHGFGHLDAEFWLGLESIYKLVKSTPHELVLVLKDFAGNTSYAKYSSWDLDRDAIDRYSSGACGSYSGTAGNVLCAPYNRTPTLFGPRPEGGFWSPISQSPWKGETGNLNGRYVPQTTGDDENQPKTGLHWADIKAGSIKATKMMIRPTRTTG